jgi:Lon protease-like protein
MKHHPDPAGHPDASDSPAAGPAHEVPGTMMQTLRPWPEDALAIVPMRNLVLFPQALTPVSIGRAASLAALQQALHEDTPPPLGFLLQKDEQADSPGPADLCEVGTRVHVLRSKVVDPSAEGDASTQHLLCLGVSRFRVREWVLTTPFLLARVDLLHDEPEDTLAQAAALALRERAADLLQLLPGVPAEVLHAVQSTREPAALGYVVAALLDAEIAEKQSWLEMSDTAARLERIPVVLDGYVVTAAAAILHALNPATIDHCIAGHLSAEGAHADVLKRLGKKPLLDLGLRLGEGTGAALAVGVMKAALACHRDMATFDQAKVPSKA